MRKSADKTERNWAAWFFAGIFFFLWAVWVNRFPEGTVLLGGDVLQILNLRENWLQLSYDWSGRAALFYALFAMVDWLGISPSGQLSWYLGAFLIGSFSSFFLFARLIFPKASPALVSSGAILYAANTYSLYIFTSTWGFTHYQVIFVFIPALSGLYLRALSPKSFGFAPIAYFLVAAFATSMSFGNPAFAVAMAIFFFILTIFAFAFGFAGSPCEWKTAGRKIALMIIGAFALNAYWILPLLPQVKSGVAGVSASTEIVLTDALRKTSNAFFDTIRLLPTHERGLYYPENFPFVSFGQFKSVAVFLSFAPFLFVLFSFTFRRQSKKESRLQWLFAGTFLFVAAGVAHVRAPFDGMNNWLFQLPGLNVLRGWDKLAVFTPFLLVASVLEAAVFLQNRFSSRMKMLAPALCVSLSVLLAPSFFVGGIQTNLSYILAGNNKKDYSSADYKTLVTVPDPYWKIASSLRDDPDEVKISRLPFAPGSSVGRINLPKWGVNGPGVERILYAKKYVEPTEVYFDSWLFAEEFSDTGFDPRWIVDWYGLIGVRYVLWHKDAREESVREMERAERFLRAKGLIVEVTENPWFTLYRLDSSLTLPHFYASSGSVFVQPEVLGLSGAAERIRKTAQPLNAVSRNPQSFTVSGISSTLGERITLNERYDPLWRARISLPDGSNVPLVRDESVRYANAWKLPKDISDESFISVWYVPMRLFHFGIFVSALALFVVLLGLFFAHRRNRGQGRKTA